MKTPPIPSAGSDRTPPKKGPIMNPSPKAAPIIPILLATCSGSLISPIYALATAIFPFPAPDKKRAIIAISRLFESPKTIKKIEFEIKPNISIGLLPNLSLKVPKIGVNMN